jgi:hypothetical protein
MLEMIPVVSSNVDAVGYDEGACALHIRFRDGDTYVYQNVPRDVFDELMAADSKGKYVSRIIRPAYTDYYKL